jgi:hypothetical protein
MSTSSKGNDLAGKMKTWITSRNTVKNLAGLMLGALGGFLYYRLIGCNSGGCAITSNPYMSVLWGAAMGYLLADIFKIKEKNAGENSEVKS